jgi:hypothetical protein
MALLLAERGLWNVWERYPRGPVLQDRAQSECVRSEVQPPPVFEREEWGSLFQS